MIPALSGIVVGLFVLAVGAAALPEGTPAWVVLAFFAGDKLRMLLKDVLGKSAGKKIEKIHEDVKAAASAAESARAKAEEVAEKAEQNQAHILRNFETFTAHIDEEMGEVKEIKNDQAKIKQHVARMEGKLDGVLEGLKHRQDS